MRASQTASFPSDDEPDDIRQLLLLILTRIDNLAKSGAQPPERQWYSTDEAAAPLNLEPWTVRNYCRIGRIAAEKLASGGWRISRDEIRRYLDHGPAPGFLG